MMAAAKTYALTTPPLEEIAAVLDENLKKTFQDVAVDVVDCPNLKDEPFKLVGEGLCGKPTLADVGGVPYLIPLAQRNKIYNIPAVAREAGIPDAFVIGAGAGPYHFIGTNCEMMANVKLGEEKIVGTYIAKLERDGSPHLEKIEDCSEFCVLGNLFLSEGKPGKVLRVSAKKRNGSKNFVTSMREILADKYGEKPVGLGGVFLLNKGKAKLHIMPDFSEEPLNSDDDVNSWLKFFTMEAPLVCLSTFISADPGLDLRVEHTHCFSFHGEGGHYHTDVTPEEAEYLGYFNVAETILRVDQPSITHQIGRD